MVLLLECNCEFCKKQITEEEIRVYEGFQICGACNQRNRKKDEDDYQKDLESDIR